MKAFHKAVFSDDEASAEIYAEFALAHSRTYILDISEGETFIASALTVVPASNGEKYLMLGGTIKPLRNKGLFSELLLKVEETEKRDFGGFLGIFIPSNVKTFLFMKNRGFSYEAFGLECSLKGNNKSKRDFINGSFAGADYILCRSVHLEDCGISVEAFSSLYKYFASRGGVFGKSKDGYVAFVSAEDKTNENGEKLSFKTADKSEKASDSKGNFIVYECALSVNELLKLPSAFKKCVLPSWKKEELERANIPFERVITALTNFQTENRFINGIQRFF